jgi:cell wall-associated NlpC family hydrolase
MKCDYPDKVNIVSWGELKPGDICEADYKDTTAGHVVIYIGTGKVSKPVSPYSFDEFTTPGNEKVFIQSIGPNKELSEPGVSYINEANFKQNYHNIKCCRVKECKTSIA